MVLWPRKTMGPWANHNSHFRSRTFKHLFNLIYNSYNLSPIILSVNQTSPQPSPIIARLGFWPPSAAVHGCWRWSPPQTAAWVPPKDMDFFCLRCRTRKRSWDFLKKRTSSTIWFETCIYIAIDGEYGSLMFFIFLWKICRNISSEMVEMKMRRTCRGIDLQLRLPWVLPFHLSRKTEKLQTPARTTWSSIPCTAIQIYIIIIYYIIIYICTHIIIYICIYVCVYIYIYHDSVDLSSKIMISMAASPGSLQSADPRSVRNAGAAHTRNAAGSVEGNSRPVGPPWYHGWDQGLPSGYDIHSSPWLKSPWQ